MTRCVCTHYHVLKCRQCGCKEFLADPFFLDDLNATGPDWTPSRDSYRYESSEAARGEKSL